MTSDLIREARTALEAAGPEDRVLWASELPLRGMVSVSLLRRLIARAEQRDDLLEFVRKHAGPCMSEVLDGGPCSDFPESPGCPSCQARALVEAADREDGA